MRGLVLVLLLTGCGFWPPVQPTRDVHAPPSDPTDVPASPELGVEYPLRITTHCGLDGVLLHSGVWLFQNRRGGNAPPGFRDPFDDGTITFLDEKTAIFRSSGGVKERLVRVEGEPPGGACL